MRGIVTYDRRDLRTLREMGLLDRRPRLHVFYEIKSVLGRTDPPVPGVHNMISCFGDNRAVQRDPGLAAVGPGGMRAVRGTPYFDWDWVCPSDEGYRRSLLDLVARAAAQAVAGIRLDTVGFPREGFCRCPRCQAAQRASGLDEETWRAATMTAFIREAVARARTPRAAADAGGGAAPRADGGNPTPSGSVPPPEPAPAPRPVSVTLYPDPFGDHLFRRFGLDVAQLGRLVDFFVVPIYDLHYSTTYWVEALAWGFRDLLGDVPFVAELYALNVDRKGLLKAARVADAYADGILLAYERAPEAVGILDELGPPPSHSRLAG
ncbi:hypothetical protein E1B22_01680 [Thermaerobacter sp. FW80]|uniref:hypothetical protein n=1 Tax=Thermaerobacter sp. FW80 TaxID=2546351 RepID=UPI001074CB49|nr:hypothetical protein [Thermaerobacter sp. FW80]QBS36787.1 hypothetical protein E1B22_01680 [Thermaerobacter sp. FW80]